MAQDSLHMLTVTAVRLFFGGAAMCYAIFVLWMPPSLPFETRFMCSAYHWTNSKLATVSWVTVPCQTQTISLLSSTHHQHYVSCYKNEMYHLYQYEYDTSSATCQYKNINMLEDCCTMGYTYCVQKKTVPDINCYNSKNPCYFYLTFYTQTNYRTNRREVSYHVKEIHDNINFISI